MEPVVNTTSNETTTDDFLHAINAYFQPTAVHVYVCQNNPNPFFTHSLEIHLQEHLIFMELTSLLDVQIVLTHSYMIVKTAQKMLRYATASLSYLYFSLVLI
jgi:hypothetical protein